jgi:putative ATP-binding cassette transporter
MVFMPQEGYLPSAALREVMTYPAGLAEVTDTALVEALEKVGLERLVSRLDDVERWDRLLDKDEEVALSVTNAVLRKPKWLIMDDVLEGLEQETRERLLDMLASLDKSTLIYIGRSEEFVQKFSPRLFHLAPLHAEAETRTEEPQKDET